MMTTFLENLEMSGNLTVIVELVFCQEIVGECQEKNLVREYLFLKNKTYIHQS